MANNVNEYGDRQQIESLISSNETFRVRGYMSIIGSSFCLDIKKMIYQMTFRLTTSLVYARYCIQKFLCEVRAFVWKECWRNRIEMCAAIWYFFKHLPIKRWFLINETHRKTFSKYLKSISNHARNYSWSQCMSCPRHLTPSAMSYLYLQIWYFLILKLH